MKVKKHESDAKVKTWVRTPTPNLIKNTSSGTYYLRARFGGGPVRESLDTQDYQAARLRLAVRLEELRGVSTRGKRLDAPADAVALLVARVKADPSIMDSTRESYLWTLGALGKGADLPRKLFTHITAEDMQSWWKRVAKAYSAQQANHLLRWTRECFAVSGCVRRNPCKELKPVKIARKRRVLLSPDQLRAVLAELRKMPRAREAADWFEFAAYSGVRPGEQMWIEWRHIDAIKGRIEVTEGKTVAQTGRTRFIPIIPPMAELLTRLPRLGDRLFPRKCPPRESVLHGACARLGLPRQRPYDLRHLFATQAIRSNVDVPTVSRWLGHSDGGALAMRTYVHPGEEHSMEAGKKVTF